MVLSLSSSSSEHLLSSQTFDPSPSSLLCLLLVGFIPSIPLSCIIVMCRFGIGIMPKVYRVSLNSMTIIMDNYAECICDIDQVSIVQSIGFWWFKSQDTILFISWISQWQMQGERGCTSHAPPPQTRLIVSPSQCISTFNFSRFGPLLQFRDILYGAMPCANTIMVVKIFARRRPFPVVTLIQVTSILLP